MEASARDETQARKAALVLTSGSDISLLQMLFIAVFQRVIMAADIVYRGMARREPTVCALPFVSTQATRALGHRKLSRSLGKHRRFLPKDKFGIAERSHLGDVESFQLRLRGDALSDEPINQQVEDEAEGEDEADQGDRMFSLEYQPSFPLN